MQYLKSFLVLATVILGGFLTEISAQTYVSGKSSGQEIKGKVFKQLINLPDYGVFDHIAFQIDGDTVILSGKVFKTLNKKAAERVVKDIDGIARVINNIEILPSSPFDDSIRLRLLKTYSERGGGIFGYLREPNPSVRLIVERGRVTLEGYVANRADYNSMNILANGVGDVFSVQNNLTVEKKDR